jgi:hypothetical protein
MFAEIVLWRLEAAVRALQEIAPLTKSRFVPIGGATVIPWRRAATKHA